MNAGMQALEGTNILEVDVLCMMAHPDDAEILAGGTLIRLKDQGYRVGIADFTRGEMGTRGTPEERMEEAACAAEIMGVDVRVNLGLPDARIENTIENRLRVVEAVREHKPALVITHDTNNRNPDHTHTALLVREACFTSGLVKHVTGRPPHRPEKILYCMEYFQFTPTFLVDITGQFERKMRAVACYRTQTFNPDYDGTPTYIASDRFAREMESRFRFFGSRIHTDFAEGFRMDTPVEIEDIVREVAHRGRIPGQGKDGT